MCTRTYSTCSYIHTCVFSSPVMSKPNGVHMCLHLTQIAIIWQFSTVLIGFCHYCYIAQSNCTQIVQMRRPVLNTSLHIVHFLYGFLSGLLKLFLICNVLMFILKMQKKWHDDLLFLLVWSTTYLSSWKKKYELKGLYFDLILSGFNTSTLKLIYSEKATKFDEIT